MASPRYLNFVLTALCVLLTLNLYMTWSTSGDYVAAVHAQGIPDEGAQRMQMIDQLKLLNTKADQLNALLISGKARVTVAMPEAPADGR